MATRTQAVTIKHVLCVLQTIAHKKCLLRSLYSEFLKIQMADFDEAVGCKIIPGTDSEVTKRVKSQLGFKRRKDPCKSTAQSW